MHGFGAAFLMMLNKRAPALSGRDWIKSRNDHLERVSIKWHETG
jgi:hypothetical protein